jgi:hypothetical protein
MESGYKNLENSRMDAYNYKPRDECSLLNPLKIHFLGMSVSLAKLLICNRIKQLASTGSKAQEISKGVYFAQTYML